MDDFKVTAIISAYNEEDIIAQTVGDLINQGIFVYFLDNHSTDATLTRIKPFLETGLLQIEKFPSGEDENFDFYPWEAILRRKEELARELDSDWFIHHDADEFRESPWEHLSLLEGIQKVDRWGYNAIGFEIFEFQPTHDHFMPDKDIRETFEYYDHVQWFNRLRNNCWKKTAVPVELASSGGHQVEFQDIRIFPVRFILRHYPIRSQAHGECKVFKDRFPRYLKSEREKNWHIQYDQVSQGHCFIRDASALTRFDADKVRLDLFLNHRELESLRETLQKSHTEISDLQQTNQAISTELTAAQSEIANLQQNNQAILTELTAAQFEISNLLQTSQALLTEMTAASSQAQSEAHLLELRLASEQSKSEHLLQALEDARCEVRALRNSWSWRITALFRKGYECLGLHRRNAKS
jgi:glycosyltransferase involved in cell wall biosynthesis